jgi:polyisoprenoid-binding protein YceI
MHALLKHTLATTAFGLALGLSGAAGAADYTIDPTHSFVEFRIQHLGYSWLYGRFNDISGTMKYDPAAPEASAIDVTIDVTSLDSNHAERDKHLRSAEFLDVEKFAKATFKSTGYKGSDKEGVLSGVLNFHGVEKAIDIPVKKIGEGKDPWGGYRAGFHGTYTMTRADFGITYDLGPASTTVELELGIEGIKK